MRLDEHDDLQFIKSYHSLSQPVTAASSSTRAPRSGISTLRTRNRPSSTETVAGMDRSVKTSPIDPFDDRSSTAIDPFGRLVDLRRSRGFGA